MYDVNYKTRHKLTLVEGDFIGEVVLLPGCKTWEIRFSGPGDIQERVKLQATTNSEYFIEKAAVQVIDTLIKFHKK